MEKYIERLFTEWKQHGKIIIAVDFDDTISPWKLQTKEDIKKSNIVKILNLAKETGAYIVCFTACNKDRFEEVERTFKSLNIHLDAINSNPIELPYGNHSKIYANIFLDDRAGLGQALEILETAMWRYRGYKKSQEQLDEIA
jgi:hypothetical protein